MSDADPTNPPVRVVLVEDQAELAFALRDLLEAEGGIQVDAVCHTLSIASALIARLAPEVVVTDFRLPDGDAVDEFLRWRTASPRTQIVVVSAWTDVRSIRRARLGGASAYLEKGVRLGELPAMIQRVARGHRWWPGQWPDVGAPGTNEDVAVAPGFDVVAATVLDGVRRGCSTAEIAADAGLSERDVRTRVNELLTAYGVASRSELRSFITTTGD